MIHTYNATELAAPLADRGAHHLSLITYPSSHITCHLSRIPYHLSLVTYHVSRITYIATELAAPLAYRSAVGVDLVGELAGGTLCVMSDTKERERRGMEGEGEGGDAGRE